MFSDVVGSTRLWGKDPDAMSASLRLHDALFSATIARFGGHVFATGGDSFAAAFNRMAQPPSRVTLYVTDGIGFVGRRGGEVHEIRPGDVVYIEPNEEHWHGATSDRFMAHVAIQEADQNGQVVTWGDHVTDDEYRSTTS